MSEQTEVTAPLKKALESLGCMVYRMPTGGYRGRMQLHPRGTPDLLVLPPMGRALNFFIAAVETKKSCRDGCPCRSCSAQRATRVELEKRGVLYVHARSVEAGLAGLGFK